MRIAVMATGGVGGYFSARLAAAGEDVHFIAGGAHLAALRANGLSLKSANGDLHLQPIFATDDPVQIGVAGIHCSRSASRRNRVVASYDSRQMDADPV